MIGETISHYQITDQLGQGGMGIVYKATDTRLQRTVALKFLPAHSLQTDDDKQRFEREAKAAAALNHPNIATVYEIDEAGGRTFIAMEFIGGETLASTIKQGPLKLSEAVEVALQVAAGLQAAHEKGIVHRDIKASNVMFTEKGQVKIMDFGLAKTAAASVLTKEGTTVGTAAYMSPEQARGQAVDHRTDLWSLGVVMYEMISGQLPFKGDYEQSILYSIMNEDPEALTGLRTGVPLALERVVAKLLMKDASLRYQSAVEIPSDLRALDLATTGTTKLMTTAATRPVAQAEAPSRPAIPWRVAAPAAVALALVAAGFLGWLLKPAPAPEPQPVARFSVTLPSTERFTRTGRHVIAFSPDGTRLVHTANGQLHLRRLDQLETSTILGTVEDIREPFFSPDGQWVAFEHVYTERLMKIAVTGGAPVPLCEVGGLFGASWGPDDMIVYGQGAGGIWRVSAAGGTPEELIAPDSTRQDLFHGPQVLPGGKAVLFTLRPEGSASWNEAQIVVASLETGARTVLIDGGTDARYLPTGHLVYVHENVLLARPFDADRLAWTGSPVALVENVSHPTFSGVAGFSVSGTGSLVYIPDRSDDAAGWEMVWINRQGALTPVIEEQRRYFAPSLSFDGRQIAVQVSDPEDGSDDVWIYGVARGAPNRLTFGGSDTQPIWTPDGTRVTYSAYRNGDSDIYWRPADRSGEAELLWGGEHHQFAYSWSPDGRFLTFDELHPETGDDIWVLDMADTTATVFLNTAAFEENAVFSPPDGKWLAYHSDETGTVEVYVRSYPGPGAQVPISIGGGHDPMWARDGRTLYYLSEQKMMAVSVKAGPPFEAGEPEALFEGEYFISYVGGERYGVHPDGERFLMLDVEGATDGEDEAPDQFKVVLNWFEELKQRVPSDG